MCDSSCSSTTSSAGVHRCERGSQKKCGFETNSICDPPALVKQMGLVLPGQKWLVHKALYGFTESPSDWSFFRDQTLQ